MRIGLVVLISLGGLAVLLPQPAAAYATTRCHGETATIVGTVKADRIVGTAGADVIAGLDGGDRIDGLAGDDLVCGGDGRDRIRGGEGDDRLDGQRDKLGSDRGGTFLVGDVLEGGPGDDHLDLGRDRRPTDQQVVGELVTFRRSVAPVEVTIGGWRATAIGEGTDRIVHAPFTIIEGSRYADSFTGSPAADFVVGGGGNDAATLGAGDDNFWDRFSDRDGHRSRSTDDDIVDGGSGRDDIWSINGADVFHGGLGDDQLSSFSDNLPGLFGDGGRDYIALPLAHSSGAVGIGGPGRDALYLNRPDEADYSPQPPSADFPDVTVDMSLGSVTTTWESVPVTAVVDAFHEVSFSNNVRLTYTGSDLSETLTVPAYRRARVFLGAGDDVAYGGSRADFFDGGDGYDVVEGGRGDTCVAVEKAYECPAP